jgi:DNA-directed RNA polymerase specialized sigma24 family protein
MNAPLLPRKEWDLTEEAFAKFLAWLNPDPDQAGRKYEDIRRRLIKILTCRGCNCPEDLSDETINRVIYRSQDIGESYVGDPALYFYGVAHNVYLEYLRKKPDPQPPLFGDESSRPEAEFECFEQCIERLTPRSRELVLQYYQEEKQAKINHRKQLALQLGIPLNALRIRACRIRANLQICVLQCLQRKPAR